MPDSPSRTCPKCATAIPASFPEGLCPKCLLEQTAPDGPATAGTPVPTLAEQDAADNTMPVPPPVSSGPPMRQMGVPSLELLRGLFPELEILDVLGAGGMGAVYKARQPRLNRLVALKIMVAAPGHETDFALRFEREAQVLARLNHPHIVILYDFGELGPERTGADPLFYFLMEFVDGTDLGQLIKSKELKPTQALAIVPQICEALQYAHDQGITHRDIKPANILLDKKGTVKIADFGLAKMVGGDAADALMTGLTQTGTAMGTPHYMAPEQWEHPQQVDHRADIYALGVVFYEMLTGERPAGVFEPPSKKSKSPVDKKLDGVVMRAMDKNPDRRYQQAGQIGDDVTRISGANKRKPTTTGAAVPKRSPLKPLLAMGAAAMLAVGGWMLWQGGAGSPPAAVPPETALPGPSAPPATALTKHEWVKVDWPGQKILPGGKPSRQVTQEEITKDGGLRLVKDDLWIGSQVPRIGMMQNGGIRLRWKRLAVKTGALDVHLRGTGNPKISLWGNAAAVFHGGPTAEFRLQSTPHGGQPPVGREVFLEIACVGRLLIVKRDGIVTGTQELPETAPADFMRFQGSEVIVTEAELINLDHLSEDEALKVLGVDSAVPAIAPAPPQPAWVPMYRQAAELAPLFGKPQALYLDFQSHAALVQDPASGLKLADGWLTPNITTHVKLPLPSARNAGVRLRVQMSEPTVSASIWLRGVDHGAVYAASWRGINRYFSTASKAAEFLAERKNLVAKKPGESFTLEFYAIGQDLIYRCDGEVIRVREPGEDRAIGTLNHLMIRNPVNDIEFINLDDLSEAEALKLAGVSEAEDSPVTGTAKPGRLRAIGTMLNGRPLDLTKLAAHDDFVDVAGGMDSWVALRANGETVSSDGKADFTGIRQIARSYQSYACFIDKAGGLRFHPAREMALPDSLKGGKVADAACGSHHGVALLEDGRAVTFGRRYEEAMEDASQPQGLGTPRWPQPEAAALQNVKGVAVTYTHAATLHHDGTVSVWGWEGPVKWKTEPEMQPVRQISSFHDALHLLDEAGQVWTFPLPRSVHPQQPAVFNGRVKLLAKDAVRLRDHLWLNADGTWRAVAADRPTVETLESATLRPETNFALSASAYGSKPFGYALWIELVDAPPSTAAISTATKAAPFVNSFGMKFVPVPITGGPTDGQRVLFSIWETRVQDYEAFVKETKREWPKSGFPQEPTHPACMVTLADAEAFCLWLTERERKAGKLPATAAYRLPSDHEWSCAVGIGAQEDAALSSWDKSGKLPGHSWGSAWPPPAGAGNFNGEEAPWSGAGGRLTGYRDAFPNTGPVGSFAANALGLHDLIGNVWELCPKPDSHGQQSILRGGSCQDVHPDSLTSSKRGFQSVDKFHSNIGFRVVLELAPSGSASVSPSSATLPPFTDREAAEWVLGLGYDACNVKVLKGGKAIEVRKLADLPAEPWVVQELRVNLSPKEQPELWGKVTDAQVMRLTGLRSLKIVDLRGNLTGASLKVMAHHPGLQSLLFEGMNLKADDLQHLRASRLPELRFHLLQVADPDSLAVLATMPNLRKLQFTACLDPVLVAALPKLPKMEMLQANGSINLTDEELPLLVERFPQLTLLQPWGARKLKGTTLGSLMALKSLTTLGLTDTSVNDEALAQIAGMPQLLTLDLGQTRITDACLPTLKSLPKLESLQIFQTELTDAALLELASIRTLKKLSAKASGYSDYKPKVTFTAAGIAAFEKLRPDVQVVK